MNQLIVKKGNLWNSLENRMDKNLIDSSEYDLEIIANKKVNQYRIRYFNAEYEAIKILTEDFKISKYSKYGVRVSEVESFCRTDTFKRNSEYQKQFTKEFLEKNSFVPSYYAFLQRITGKKNLKNSRILYKFSLPAVGIRKKEGVVSYDINIELVRDKFYVVFFKENVAKGYFQSEEVQYFIYDDSTMKKAQEEQDDIIIDLAIKEGYPLNLLQYIYLITGSNIKQIHWVFQELTKLQNIQEFYTSPLFRLMNQSMDKEFIKELTRYLAKEQGDIEYSYNNKMIRLTK